MISSLNMFHFSLIKNFSRTFITSIFLLCSFSILAKQPVFTFDEVGYQYGMTNGVVLKVIQDKQGYIWSATQGGLHRFDGYHFKVFKNIPNDKSSLANNYVQTIFEDRDGGIWIGTSGGILHQYHPQSETFTRFPFDQEHPKTLISNSRIMSIAQDADGALWIGTYGAGVHRFEIESQTFTHSYQNSPADQTSLSDNDVLSVLIDQSNILWVSGGNSLNRFDTKTQTFKRYLHNINNDNSVSDKLIYTLFEDSEQLLWIASLGGGLTQFDPQTENFIHFKNQTGNLNSLSNDHVTSIYEDQTNRLWIGTRYGGLNRFNSENNRFERFLHNPQDKTSISSNGILSIMQDRGGLFWIGTLGNFLNRFDPSIEQFGVVKHYYGQENSLSDGSVRAVFKDKKGIHWIGVESGLDSYNQHTGKFSHYRNNPQNSHSLSANDIRVIFEDSEQNLWVGTASGGLNKLNQRDKELGNNIFQHFRHQTNNIHSLSHDHITAINQDSFGNLWIGTLDGLNRFDPINNQFVGYQDSKNGLIGSSVSVIYVAPGGIVWIGTNGGLNRFDSESKEFKNYSHDPDNKNSLSDNRIFSINQDQNDTLWIGTAAGLNKLDPITEKFIHYKEEQGLEDSRVAAVTFDNNNKMWLGVGSSLMVFDPVTEEFYSVDSPCGVNQGAYHQADDGELLFGKAGYCAFHPKDITHQSLPPKIVLSDFRLANKSVDISRNGLESVLKKTINHTDSITLTHKDNILSFEFAAIDFSSPRDNKYRYKLEGFNDDWIDTGANNRRATYTNLPDSKYVFRVKASNNKGVWNEQGRSIELIVLPPAWRTWWAYSLYGIILILTIIAFIRSQIKKVDFERRLNRTLEKKVKRRTYELEEKNNELNHALTELEKLSLTDQLTGTHNRHFVNKFIAQELANLQREYYDTKNTRPPIFGFIMIDADHFKSVNDTYGHDAGDQVLIQLANILTETCRGNDWVIRWGGEEFLIITKSSTRDNIEKLAERIRSNIEKHEFVIGKDKSIRKTCSIGISSYPFIKNNLQALTWEQTLNIADLALYAAKNNGRNMWVSLFENKINEPEKFYESAMDNLDRMIQSKEIGFQTSSDNKNIKF